jgi:DNA-binding HxlR family transcriptional regulator
MANTKLPYKRSPCPVSGWLDFFGDKWTLLIIRDLMAGKTRYGQFLESPEGIPTNILADRLKRLEEGGVVSRERYSDRPPRHEYRLTRRGAELVPVMQAMCVWGRTHIGDTWSPPDWFTTASADTFVAKNSRRKR